MLLDCEGNVTHSWVAQIVHWNRSSVNCKGPELALDTSEMYGFRGQHAYMSEEHVDYFGRSGAKSFFSVIESNAPYDWELGFECSTLHPARGRERATVIGKSVKHSENQGKDWEEARRIELIEHMRYHIGDLRGFRE